MAPSTSDYEQVPRADDYTDAVMRPSVSEDSDSDDALEYTGRTKRRSLAEAERSRYDAETLGGQEEVERLLVSGKEKAPVYAKDKPTDAKELAEWKRNAQKAAGALLLLVEQFRGILDGIEDDLIAI